MKTIIVTTDFSPEAKNATNYILPMAKARDYRVVLFYLHNVSIHALNARLPGFSLDSILLKEKQKVANASKELQRTYFVEVIPYFTTGIFYEELERCISENNATFVVMGMAEKSVDQDLLGNTTTAAINKLKIPILAVPLNAKFEGIKKILFACDLSRGVHQKVLDNVRLIAHDMGAEVEVFYVKDQVDRILTNTPDYKMIEKELIHLHVSYKDVISSRIIESIKQELDDMQADLLIMVPFRYGFWNSLVHRSKTRMMAYGNNIPLLSIPLG